MNREVISVLSRRTGGVFIDCTVGLGGHAGLILEKIPDSIVIGIDMDKESLKIAGENLKRFKGRVTLINLPYEDIFDSGKIEWDKISGVLIDPGLSMFQLKNGSRGFSHISDSKLDMRKDRSSEPSAHEVINKFKEADLMTIFSDFGDISSPGKLAKRIIEKRLFHPIDTTGELKNIVEEVYGWRPVRGRSHPAARVFQALRIFVNRELERVEEFITKIPDYLGKGALFIFLTYHSIEDRIVKRTMKSEASMGRLDLIKPFPFKPSDEEISMNFASRSAKMRAASIQ